MRLLTLNAFIRPFCINSYYNSIISYWNGKIKLKELFDGDFKDKRLEELFCNILKNDYDVVCLQEVFNDNVTDRMNRIKKFANKNKFYLYCPTDIIFCKSFTSSGLCIMSKYPIVDSDFIKYRTKVCFPNVLSNCGFLSVTVLNDNKRITIINLHLQSGVSKIQENIRYKQIDEIYEYINQQLPSENVIVTGDFNADLRLWKYISKKFEGFKDPFLDTMLNDVYTFRYFNTCEIQRFDGILYKFPSIKFKDIKSRVDPLKCEKIGYFEQVSDHSGIITDFIM